MCVLPRMCTCACLCGKTLRIGVSPGSPLVYVSECMCFCVYVSVCTGMCMYVYICVLMYEWGGYAYVCTYVWVYVYM